MASYVKHYVEKIFLRLVDLTHFAQDETDSTIVRLRNFHNEWDLNVKNNISQYCYYTKASEGALDFFQKAIEC